MPKRNSLMPVLLLLFFPIVHVWFVSLFVPPEGQTGFWQIGATGVFFMDGFFVVTVLALLKLPSLSWRWRERGMLFVTVLGVTLCLFQAGNPMGLVLFGGHLAVLALSWLWLSPQHHLREKHP